MFSLGILGSILLAVALSQLANLGTTLYLHRSLTHRALTMSQGLALVWRWVLWLSVGIDRREWVAVHRKHHAFTDEMSDPHSPLQRGLWNVFLLNAHYYRNEAKDPETIAIYGKDLPRDRLDRLVFSHGNLGPIIGIVGLVVLFGPLSAAITSVLHMVFYIAIGGMVNSFGHHYGRRPHANSATNLRWLALVSGGEGMHNEHHEFPRSPRFGTSWWDLGGKLAGGLAKLKLVTLHESTRFLRQAQLDHLQQVRQPESVS